MKEGHEPRAQQPAERLAHGGRAKGAPTPSAATGIAYSASRILALQRAAGNRAVSRLAPLIQRRASTRAVGTGEVPADPKLAAARLPAEGAVAPAGTSLVQRDPPDGEPAAAPAAAALPKIDHLPAMAQTLLEGVLEKKTIDAAIRQIYDNMFQKTGWKYMASEKNISGSSYINGGKTTGMCESYRNAFAEILTVYDRLRPSHPEAAIKNGALNIVLGNDLSNQRFATRQGLTLMGATALKGNVYLQVDGSGNVVAQGLDGVNIFVFYGHWTLKVNGVEYDPIFHSIGQDNIGALLDKDYVGGAGQFFADVSKPIATNEFGATFIHVTDIAGFRTLLTKIEQLERDISSAGIFGKSKAKKNAKAFFKTIPDRAALAQVVEAGYNAGKITRDLRNTFKDLNAKV